MASLLIQLIEQVVLNYRSRNRAWSETPCDKILIFVSLSVERHIICIPLRVTILKFLFNFRIILGDYTMRTSNGSRMNDYSIIEAEYGTQNMEIVSAEFGSRGRLLSKRNGV